jgi:hypothetical protein
MRLTSGGGPGAGEEEDVVNWDGVLSLQERSRIFARLHSAFGAVGAAIPDYEVLDGRRIPLKRVIFDYLGKPGLTRKELQAADGLAEGLGRKVKDLEARLREGELTEQGAVDLMKEALGLMRALQHLRGLRDPENIRLARRDLLVRVDDESRWLEFLKKVKL